MPTTAGSSTAEGAATSAGSTSTGEMLVPPHQIAGMIPAGFQAFLGRLRIIPVTGEDVCPANQEFSGLAVGDISAIVVDQPDLRALHDSRDRPALQTEGQGSNDFCCSPDVIEGRAKD